jgi:hypothetical protein
MTVTEIVKDLLKYKMITEEAATVLLRAEADAIAYRVTNSDVSATYSLEELKSIGIWTTTTTNDKLK